MSTLAWVLVGVGGWLVVMLCVVSLGMAAARGDRMMSAAIREERQRRWREQRGRGG